MMKNIKEEITIEYGKLPDYIGYQVRQAQVAVFRDLTLTMKKIGITPGEFSLLTMVNANPSINQIDLARIYQLDKSTLSFSINNLKKRRLIQSIRNKDDRRYYSLQLSAIGRSTLQRATKCIEKQESVMDAVLKSGERKQLLDLLYRISRAFESGRG